MYDFRFYFNRKRQFCEVFLWEVHPTTFARWGGGRWGYYQPQDDNNIYGKIGEIHLISKRIRVDLVSHELTHVVFDWFGKRNIIITSRTEETFASILDEMIRSFYR